MYLYGSNQGATGRIYFESWDIYLNKFGKEPLGNATFKHLKQVVQRKEVVIFFYVFQWFKIRTLGEGSFWPLRPIFEQT